MARQKDMTPVECKLCKQVVPASGIPSHLFNKHPTYNSNTYATEFGEFRASKFKLASRISSSTVTCRICNEQQVSHKQLLHHIHIHNISWQDYYLKYYFNGVHPICSCGCNKKVKLIRHGKLDNGTESFTRLMLPGHHSRNPGYRSCTQEQKMKMRQAAILRLQKEGRYYTKTSSYEKILLDYLTELGISTAVANDRTILSGAEIDIYCPDQKIGIEINGSYFHSDAFKKKDYHLKKTEECAYHGIRLVHIWEPDIYSKLDILKSNIANLLGKTTIKLHGRKTTLKVVTSTAASKFLNDNHLQGSCPSKIRLGLYTDGELVSLMTFGSLRRATGHQGKEGSYELLRFCNKLNTTVVGGASKLYKHFMTNYHPDYVLSYANRDWSTGNLYEKLGMTLAGKTAPGYFYTKSKIKYSRYTFRKQELVKQGADPNQTEFSIMDQLGYSRVWNCGNYKYVTDKR